MVGPDRYDATGDYRGCADPAVTSEELTAMIRFLTREQVDAWARQRERTGTRDLLVE